MDRDVFPRTVGPAFDLLADFGISGVQNNEGDAGMSTMMTYAACATTVAVAATFLVVLWNFDPVYVKAAFSAVIVSTAAFMAIALMD